MVINMEADLNERHALVLLLFIAPDIIIIRMAKGEGESCFEDHSAFGVLFIMLWKTMSVVMRLYGLVYVRF